jgi:hypothetical protein
MTAKEWVRDLQEAIEESERRGSVKSQSPKELVHNSQFWKVSDKSSDR